MRTKFDGTMVSKESIHSSPASVFASKLKERPRILQDILIKAGRKQKHQEYFEDFVNLTKKISIGNATQQKEEEPYLKNRYRRGKTFILTSSKDVNLEENSQIVIEKKYSKDKIYKTKKNLNTDEDINKENIMDVVDLKYNLDD